MTGPPNDDDPGAAHPRAIAENTEHASHHQAADACQGTAPTDVYTLTVPAGFYGRDWAGADCWVDRDGQVYAGDDGPFQQRTQVIQLRPQSGERRR